MKRFLAQSDGSAPARFGRHWGIPSWKRVILVCVFELRHAEKVRLVLVQTTVGSPRVHLQRRVATAGNHRANTEADPENSRYFVNPSDFPWRRSGASPVQFTGVGKQSCPRKSPCLRVPPPLTWRTELGWKGTEPPRGPGPGFELRPELKVFTSEHRNGSREWSCRNISLRFR